MLKRLPRPAPLTNQQSAEQLAKRVLADHVMVDTPVRAFRFRSAGASTAYWFTITWTPGHLTIAGDVGELTLTHYHALRWYEEGIRWAARAEVDYLIGKSGRRKDELSRERTVAEIIEFANENAIDAMRGSRDEATVRRLEHREALVEWKSDLDQHCREGGNPDTFGDPPEMEKAPLLVFREHPQGKHGLRTLPPEGFELWHALREAVCDHLDHEVIFTAKGRRTIKRELVEHLDDLAPDEIARFCSDMGIDDYYGAYDYTHSTYMQVIALRYGARMLADQFQSASAWGDPVV